MLKNAMTILEEKGINFKFSKMTIYIKHPVTKQWMKVPLIESSNKYFMRLIEDIVLNQLSR